MDIIYTLHPRRIRFKTFTFFLLILLTLIFVGCKEKESDRETKVLPPDFESFYENFHNDSLFQMSHINFPLEGATRAKGSNLDVMIPVKWEKENWIMHKPFNDHNNTFQRDFFMVGPVIVEKIADKNQFFSMERRFSKFGNEWQLIYYAVSN